MFELLQSIVGSWHSNKTFQPESPSWPQERQPLYIYFACKQYMNANTQKWTCVGVTANNVASALAVVRRQLPIGACDTQLGESRARHPTMGGPRILPARNMVQRLSA